jgi:hypothetical protein
VSQAIREDTTMSDVERLRQALRIERECCASLAEVLRAERAAAHAHELDGLLSALREREAIQARWEAAARRRGEILAGVTSSDATPALVEGSIGSSAGGCEAPDDPELAALRAGLAAEAARLRREQAVNEAVLRGALEGVNDLLAALRRHLPGARYDRGANVTATGPGAMRPGWRA